MKKALVILLAVILYFNIGYYLADRYTSIGLDLEYSSAVDELIINGKDDCLMGGRKERFDWIIFSIIATIWPIFLIMSIITWAWWLIFSGGLLEIMGAGTFFSITACLVLLKIGMYFMRKSKE